MKIRVTATLSPQYQRYDDFGISPITASLYGHNKSDIVIVELETTELQTVPSFAEEQVRDKNDGIYWGWFDGRSGSVDLVYPAYFLLNMCFPSGIKAIQDRGDGIAYRFTALSTCELPRK